MKFEQEAPACTDGITTHERSLEIQICELMDLLREFGMNF
jgi:hypothetical protein